MQSRIEQIKKVQANFDKLFQEKNLFKKVAQDKNIYNSDYTEVQALRDCEFVEIDGKLEADIRKTYSYQLNYAPGCQYTDELSVEMIVLAQYLGIQFDPETDFHNKLIVSDPRSIEVLRKADVIVEKSAITETNRPKSPRLFGQTETKPLVIDMTALKKDEKRCRAELADLESQVRKKAKTLNNLSALVNGNSLYINGRDDERLELPNGVEPQPILESYYKLRELMHAKFLLKPSGAWNPQSNTITVKFGFMYNIISPEIKNASRFLCAMGAPVKRGGDNFSGDFAHILTQQHAMLRLRHYNYSKIKHPRKSRKLAADPPQNVS